MVPASNFRQWPLLLHISTALAKPPALSPPVPGAVVRSVTGSFCTFQADQSKAGSSAMVSYGDGAESGGKRNKEASSIFGGDTILPGLSNPAGSRWCLIATKASFNDGPNCHSIHSPRHRPSPCSPLYEPLYLRTSSEASCAMARIFVAPSRRMSRMGRTCRVPTEACAYQVPCVPYFANMLVSASV